MCRGLRGLDGSVFSSWPIGCEFDPGSQQLLGERGYILDNSKLINSSRTIWS